MVGGGVFGDHHPPGDLAGVEALAKQSQDFGLASGQSAGPGVEVQAVRRGTATGRVLPAPRLYAVVTERAPSATG